MRIFRHTAGIPDSARGGTIAIGNFDGVHRGHQAVIGEALRVARERNVPMGVVTFDPHPRRYFRPEEPPFQLTPMRGKVRQLRGIGVDTLQIIHFDEEVSQAPAEDFVDRVIVNGLSACHVSVGYDFVFGKGRGGDVGLLKQMSETHGFGLSVIDPVTEDEGTVYSSTQIRECLRSADPNGAANLLGRLWEIEGRVQSGDQRGREIGFPTANVSMDDYVEPAHGVYAVWAGIEVGGITTWHPGCANLGLRPTFDKNEVMLETYIFDFADDIYNQLMRVALVDYIRPEKKFESVSQLREQIALDSKAARTLLESIEPGDLRAPPEDPKPS